MRKIMINSWLLIIITILVLYFSLKDNFVNIINNIVNFNLWWLFVAILLLFMYLIFKLMSLRLLLKKSQNEIPFLKLLKIIILVEFFQGITPFAFGGQPAQIYMLKKKGLSLSTATNISIQQFLTYQIALVFIGIIAVIFNYQLNLFPENSNFNKVVFLGFMVDMLIVLLMILISFGKNTNYKLIKIFVNGLNKIKLIKNKEMILEKIEQNFNKFYKSGLAFRKNKFQFFQCIFYNFMALILYYSIPAIIFYGFGSYNIIFIKVIVAAAFTRFIGAIIPIPGATGGIELSFINFYKNLVDNKILLSSMLIWRFITYYLPLITGAILLNFYKKKGD